MVYLTKELNKKKEELMKQGVPIYSISRLNSFNQCKYGYYKTYIEGNRGKDNVYSIAGSSIHDVLENIYTGKATKEDLIKAYDGTMMKCEMFGIKFPTEQIEQNWKKDMSDFVHNFTKIDLKGITEQFILFEVLPDIWIQGYIDMIFADDKDLFIVDWKSSSEFKGEKLLEAGRQLALYKLAIEELTGREVKKVAWFMMKYVYVNYNGRKKMCSRRRWVKDISSMLKTDLKRLDTPEFVIPMMIDEAVNNNNLDNMPKEIQEKYILEDCMLYYDVTNEIIKELKDYVKTTVEAIQSENEWKHKDFKFVNSRGKEVEDTFFCNTLCNHRDTCPYIKEYNAKFVEGSSIENVMSLF